MTRLPPFASPAALCAALVLVCGAAPARAEWTRLGAGDCAGADVGTSKGLSPARSRCNASTGGLTAVCWDGGAQRNPAMKGAGCVYKNVRAEACQGGAHPGTLFRCDGFPLATPRPKTPAKAAPAKGEPPKAGPDAGLPAEAPAEAPAAPNEPAARKKVQAVLNHATELFAAKDFAGALAELRRAQGSEDLAVVRFNIARCLEELERLDEAVQAYQDYLMAPDAAAGADVRRGYAHQTIALLTGASELPDEAPGEERLAWRLLRTDDCGGEEAGLSDGAMPSPALCAPATAGTAAVCWDGARHQNPAFSGPACVYKSASASACRGGPNPGALYECGSAPPQPPRPPPASRSTSGEASYSWAYAGPGDCAGGDAAQSKGADPLPERCDEARAGKLAVCWDGMTQRHPSLKGSGCAYKTFGAKACKPGSTPGLLFECVAENAPISHLLGAPPPPATPPAAAQPAKVSATPPAAKPQPKPGTWVPAGTGDCVGAPTGVSKGLGPARARCDSAHLGQVAICWDGTRHKNPSVRGAGCSYQATQAGHCRGGPHPGALFRCGP